MCCSAAGLRSRAGREATTLCHTERERGRPAWQASSRRPAAGSRQHGPDCLPRDTDGSAIRSNARQPAMILVPHHHHHHHHPGQALWDGSYLP